MEFEWDEHKNAENRKKHGVDFRDILPAFLDPNGLYVPDQYPDEERWDLIALVNKVFFVVYTERGDVTRIISARCATRSEIDDYTSNAGRN